MVLSKSGGDRPHHFDKWWGRDLTVPTVRYALRNLGQVYRWRRVPPPPPAVDLTKILLNNFQGPTFLKCNQLQTLRNQTCHESLKFTYGEVLLWVENDDVSEWF